METDMNECQFNFEQLPGGNFKLTAKKDRAGEFCLKCIATNILNGTGQRRFVLNDENDKNIAYMILDLKDLNYMFNMMTVKMKLA